MSLHNDDRRFMDGEEYEQWRREIKDEYRRQEAHDRYCEEVWDRAESEEQHEMPVSNKNNS